MSPSQDDDEGPRRKRRMAEMAAMEDEPEVSPQDRSCLPLHLETFQYRPCLLFGRIHCPEDPLAGRGRSGEYRELGGDQGEAGEGACRPAGHQEGGPQQVQELPQVSGRRWI